MSAWLLSALIMLQLYYHLNDWSWHIETSKYTEEKGYLVFFIVYHSSR